MKRTLMLIAALAVAPVALADRWVQVGSFDAGAYTGVVAQMDTATITNNTATDGSMVVTVRYQRYQAFDEIRRASVLTLSFPDGTEATLYVRQLRSVGRISAEGMHLHVPSGSVVVDLQDFLSRLEHVGNG